jgi:hypothetical protein
MNIAFWIFGAIAYLRAFWIYINTHPNPNLAVALWLIIGTIFFVGAGTIGAIQKAFGPSSNEPSPPVVEGKDIKSKEPRSVSASPKKPSDESSTERSDGRYVIR